MKPFVWMMAALATVVVLLGVWVVTHETRTASDCSQRIFIVKRPDGEALECVCDEGTLATCFKPEP
jgi:hypothetical protein